MKAYKTADGRALLFRPEKNMARLNRSNERLCIPLVDEAFCVEALKSWSALKRIGSLQRRALLYICVRLFSPWIPRWACIRQST